MVVGRARLRDLPVEEAAPLCGRALDEEEVLRREEHGVERADELLEVDHLAVPCDLPPLAAPEEERESPLCPETRKGQLQRAGLLAKTDEVSVLMRAVRASERGIADGLEQIRLALRVRAEEDVDALIEREREMLIVAVVL